MLSARHLAGIFGIILADVQRLAAFDLDTDYLETGDERTVFTSGGTYYLALNTTAIVVAAVAAGAFILGLILLGGFLGGGPRNNNHQRFTNHREEYPYLLHRRGLHQHHHLPQHQQQTSMTRDQLLDFTNQLYLLAEAFKKYEVNETACQMYVACESAHVSSHEKNGKLAQLVYKIMSVMIRPENEELIREDPYMKDITSAFKVGAIGTDCARFKKFCKKEKIF